MNRSGGYGGYTDWVVPHIEDLASLIRCNTGFKVAYDRLPAKRGGTTTIDLICKDGYQNPTIDRTIFPNTPSEWYWSASPYAHGRKNYAWNVDFHGGGTGDHYKYGGYHVRAVRAGHKQR